MTDLQVVAVVFGAIAPVVGSQFFLYYKIGRMEQRIKDSVNGNINTAIDTAVDRCWKKTFDTNNNDSEFIEG